MKTKLVFSTESKDLEHWTDLPFIPRLNEWINVKEILKDEDVRSLLNSSNCWSGIKGNVQSVEYRYDFNEFYSEIYIWCED